MSLFIELAKVNTKLDAIEATLATLAAPVAATVDLAPVLTAVAEVSAKIGDVPAA